MNYLAGIDIFPQIEEFIDEKFEIEKRKILKAEAIKEELIDFIQKQYQSNLTSDKISQELEKWFIQKQIQEIENIYSILELL